MSLSEVLNAALIALEVARKNQKDYEAACKAAALESFKAAGGCPSCLGHGGWSTAYHDGDSVWDRCTRPDCSHGKMPAFQFTMTAEQNAENRRLWDAIALADDAVQLAEANATVSKGKLVKVFKGRKVPIGTVGRVIWIGESTFGKGRYAKTTVRIGIKDAADTVHWTAADNVEVIELAPVDVRPAAEQPTKGRKVRHGNTIGIVFWYGRGRDGVSFRVGYNALEGRKVSKEATWADAKEVEVMAA